MSVFFKNSCQYSDCRKNFISLSDLIVHIENDHLDLDPKTAQLLEENQPDYVPMSYVLRFGAPGDVAQEIEPPPPKEAPPANVTSETNHANNKDYSNVKPQFQEVPRFSGRNPYFVLNHNSKKPFACRMPGCSKRYKNVNGMKYHYRTYHKMCRVSFKAAETRQVKVSKRHSRNVFDDVLCRNVASEKGLVQDYVYRYTAAVSGELVPLHSSSFDEYYSTMEEITELCDICHKCK